MKQHPIPQNILDIEFKLFTKFTVREFVYMAVGVGFGGIFLYLFTKEQVPGIIAFPIFIVSSGMGLFLGLVPINDQKADVFLKNYIIAISNPTQRVWRNKDVDERFSKEDIQGQITASKGSMLRNIETKDKIEIIGSSTDSAPVNQFIDEGKLYEIEKEEAERLADIDKTLLKTDSSFQEKKIQIEGPQTPVSSVSKPTIQNAAINKVIITSTNANQYTIKQNQERAGFQIRVVDKKSIPIPNAIVTLKDKSGRVIFAQRSNSNGDAFSNRIIQNGTYIVDAKAENKTFPSLEIFAESSPINSVIITAE